jgi:hypothetical protein
MISFPPFGIAPLALTTRFMIGSGADGAGGRVQANHQARVFADEPLKYVLDTRNKLVLDNRFSTARLAAAEREKLSGKVGSPLRRFKHLFHVGAQRIVSRKCVQRHLTVPAITVSKLLKS